MSEFEFNGGVWKPTAHTQEKFLLFFVVSGKEIPMFQLLQDGVVLRKEEGKPIFLTGLPYGKLFVGQGGFGIPKRFHSFYFRFADGEAEETVTIRPFSLSERLYFKARIKFLKVSEVLDLLDAENESRRFIQRQEPLPLDTLHKLISVEKGHAGKVRHVRIGRNLNRGT
jgi:hypothetical protein